MPTAELRARIADIASIAMLGLAVVLRFTGHYTMDLIAVICIIAFMLPFYGLLERQVLKRRTKTTTTQST